MSCSASSNRRRCFGNTLLIQVSGDLANWVSLSTNVVTGNPIDFTDIQGASFQPRFYRAVVQPAP
jgi:hypothetical protein